ncbi:uroporphyrinogen decarboxylase [Pacificimonas flava]|uniref:Uroporphyrinogen decarboxylase n=2 Tax=Pacificimonas TaxID=1960290 RepID=A0A219B2U3_9SPHN|nr:MULTISPECIES: uroporphyrinogen decarboxylase [Pacificimonas]MBZ6377630.1 uroporphyrinogen decarboxylase [Pacificimonas aurantium]OWV32682.1 uroporphyrinogen decarboxylase [Pacificimonas flava]
MAETPSFLKVLKGETCSPPPVWFMRQAGRYLPEYRELRAEKGGFLDLVYDPPAAAEVTLQPLRRFGFDAAILFSDILIVPHALGQDLRFEAGEGPRLSPRVDETDLGSLSPSLERLEPIYETVRLVRGDLPEGAALIGFAGSPWTVATYMVAGEGTKEQAPARLMAYRDRPSFELLIERLVDTTSAYLIGQIEAGAQAVQLFDSWSGSLAPAEFDRWVIEPTRRIVDRLRRDYPCLPIIGFPKGAGARLADYAAATGIDALGLDETVDPDWAAKTLPRDLPLQGNLDPMALLAGGPALTDSIRRIRGAFSGRPHIFNLGHGISKDTPIAHVEAALQEIRA